MGASVPIYRSAGYRLGEAEDSPRNFQRGVLLSIAFRLTRRFISLLVRRTASKCGLLVNAKYFYYVFIHLTAHYHCARLHAAGAAAAAGAAPQREER